MIGSDYDGIESGGEELDFAESDSLPWLESEEEDDQAGAVDKTQMLAFIALLAVIAISVIGAVYLVSNYNRGPVAVPDGSLIEAPEGPYKERPDNAGGKTFAGTDDVAPGVSQGQSPDSRMADDTGAASGDQNLGVAMPAIGGGASGSAGTDGARGAGATQGGSDAGASAAGASNGSGDAPAANSGGSSASSQVDGVGIQVGAYSSRARAEQGWQTLQRQSSALSGVQRRILEGRSDSSSVFRLQAVAPTLAEANALCRKLRSEGLDCQVKP